MSKARDLANAGTALTTVSATELGYLDGVTSAVQTQIDAKQAVVSGVDSTEIGYLDGVTSAIQTQINAQIPKSTITTKGDLIVGTGAGTLVRQSVGTNGQLLSADSAEADGVKWVDAPSSGGMTLLSTTNLSGNTSVTVSSINSTYRHLYIDISGATWNTGAQQITFNVNNMGADVTQAAATSVGTAVATAVGQTKIELAPNINAHQSNGFRSAIHVFDYANSDANRVGTFTTWAYSNPNYRVFNGGFAWYSGTAVNSITVAGAQSYTFTAGTVKVWGIK